METTKVGNDLGIMVTTDDKCSTQVEAAVKNANWTLGRIRRTL